MVLSLHTLPRAGESACEILDAILEVLVSLVAHPWGPQILVEEPSFCFEVQLFHVTYTSLPLAN